VSVTETEVVRQLHQLLRDRLTVDVPAPDADLIDSGLLDSLGLVMLISGLEELFAFELPLDDFDLDRFRSLERIAEYLNSLGVLEARGTW
jgi:D-alanine--poly(phosphoribitol) ligase subunit 2